MTATTLAPYELPTWKQVNFVKSLLDDREVPATLAAETLQGLDEGTMSRKLCSITINRLLSLPKRVKALPGLKGELEAAKLLVPKSRYAIPATELVTLLENTNVHGDLLFVELKEWQKRLYFRRLHGAPGGFSRTNLDTGDAIALLKHISDDPYKYTRIFGAHYSCCGKCGAELTDQTSRELFLGPICRKGFTIPGL